MIILINKGANVNAQSNDGNDISSIRILYIYFDFDKCKYYGSYAYLMFTIEVFYFVNTCHLQSHFSQ